MPMDDLPCLRQQRGLTGLIAHQTYDWGDKLRNVRHSKYVEFNNSKEGGASD